MAVPTGLAYDERMMGHRSMQGRHPECPERIRDMWRELTTRGYVARCTRITARDASDDELKLVHTPAYVNSTAAWIGMSQKELKREAEEFNSIYLNKKSLACARLAAGCTCELTHQVLLGAVRNGAAVVRPPGHHAEQHCAMGFCIYNSVAVAAKRAVTEWGARRVLIVDWDVHHGNGTQNMFYDSSSVMYFSAHRFDGGSFYPCQPDAGPSFVGSGSGRGYNINIGWNERNIGDAEYLAAFEHVLMPIAREYEPDLVLISAGFDAAAGDPLGGCKISPAGYAHMTHMLQSLAGGKVVVVLEGGYNLRSISHSMAACVGSLLNDPLPPLQLSKRPPLASALKSINATISAHREFWRFLTPLDLSQEPPHSILESYIPIPSSPSTSGSEYSGEAPSDESELSSAPEEDLADPAPAMTATLVTSVATVVAQGDAETADILAHELNETLDLTLTPTAAEEASSLTGGDEAM
eukprot:m.64561 g.64561  ORF g.64561 m.64561 type:complete len:468 (+) comp7527_c0_seq1:2-1405(+)